MDIGKERTLLPRDSRPAHPSAPLRSYLPLFVFLAYTAFLISGFGLGLGALQPVPIYVFYCLVLLTLQETLAADRSLAHTSYVFISSVFAVLYAGEVVFQLPHLDFTRNPMTYILLNAVLAGVFVYDLLNRRLRRSGERAGDTPLDRYASIASDFGAAAVFFFVAALLLDLLGHRTVLQWLGLSTNKPYVVVDLNAALHLSLQGVVSQLQGLDFVLGLVALAGAGVFLVIAGTLLPASEAADPQHGGADGEVPFPLRRMVRAAAAEAVYALRTVMGPLVWLVPAFCAALFAQVMTHYFRVAAFAPGGWLNLINPFSPIDVANFVVGLWAALLAILAGYGMLFAVVVTEQSPRVFRGTVDAILTLGRGVTLSLAFFMATLSTVNILVVLLGISDVKPFQFGLPGVLALFLGIIWVVGESRNETLRARTLAARGRQQGRPGDGPATIPIRTPTWEQR
jgi:hypothetical protein